VPAVCCLLSAAAAAAAVPRQTGFATKEAQRKARPQSRREERGRRQGTGRRMGKRQGRQIRRDRRGAPAPARGVASRTTLRAVFCVLPLCVGCRAGRACAHSVACCFCLAKLVQLCCCASERILQPHSFTLPHRPSVSPPLPHFCIGNLCRTATIPQSRATTGAAPEF
jgi:hypothetical protein